MAEKLMCKMWKIKKEKHIYGEIVFPLSKWEKEGVTILDQRW